MVCKVKKISSMSISVSQINKKSGFFKIFIHRKKGMHIFANILVKWGGLISVFVPQELCGFMCKHFRHTLLLLVSYRIMGNFSLGQVKENIQPEIHEADSTDIE